MPERRILFVVPTHQRVHRQITLAHLPDFVLQRTLVVTSMQEEATAIRGLWGSKLGHTPISCHAEGIASKRHKIMHYVYKHDLGTMVLFFDDDMTFFARCPATQRTWNDGWQPASGNQFLNYATPQDWSSFIAWANAARVCMLGMSSRMGNNRVQPGVVHNTRMMHTFGVDVETYIHMRLRFDAVHFREDMHVALAMLTSGQPNSLYMDMCCSPGSYGAPGGCSRERTVEASNADALKLAGMYPGLVRVTDKAYKGSVNRKEVVVQWKRAYEQGARTR